MFAALLVVVWGPAPALRQIGYIVAFGGLLALGVHALRRQTAREFPDAQAGDAMSAIRGWNAERGHAAIPASVVVGGNSGSRIADFERLTRLHDSGALSDAEFTAEKAALRNGS